MDSRVSSILLIAPSADETMRFFSGFLSIQRLEYFFLTWEDVFASPVDKILLLSETLGDYCGVYVREPALFDFKSKIIMDAVYCELSSHGNVIAPAAKSTNWSKYLHGVVLERALEMYNFDLAYPQCSYGISPSNRESRQVIKAVSNLPSPAKRLTPGLKSYYYDDLEGLSVPFVFQELIDGEEIRSHVIDDKVVSVKLAALKMYGGPLNPMLTILPENLQLELVALTKMEGLRFSGVDIVSDGFGRFYILEVNPMPGYHSFDEIPLLSSKPVSELLVRSLLSVDK